MTGRFRRTSIRAAAAGVLLVLAASCGVASGGSTRLSACTVQGVSARCGTVTVPEDRSVKNGRRIALRVVVVPATSGAALPDPVVYFAGGPGGAATDAVGAMALPMGTLNHDRDLVFVDQRGTGGSHALMCPADAGDPARLAQDLTSCAASLDGDVRMYTTAAAADDVADVLHALGYARADLYGASYGATIAQVYQRRHPATVRTMTLIAGTLLDVPIFQNIPRASQAALDAVIARCASTPDCRTTFPHLRQEWRRVMVGLAVTPVIVPADRSPSHTEVVVTVDTFAAAIHQLLLLADTAVRIPALVHALATTDDPVSTVADYLQRFQGLTTDGGEPPAMTYTIRCAEPWARFDPAAVAAAGTGSYYRSTALANAEFWRRACAAWPPSGAAADYGPATVTDTPVLIINGGADPQDPPANMAGANRIWPNSRQLVEPGQSHNMSDWICQESLVDAFVARGSAADLDASCLDAMFLPPIPVMPG